VDRYAIVDPESQPTGSFQTCDVAVQKLTESLGCTDLRVNQIVLEPGDVATPHRHDGQEEVFVPRTAGQIAIEGEVHNVPAGRVVRVAPPVVRNLLNRTDDTHRWLAFGAPPVGTVEDFGSYVLPDDEE
jgi:quercetin dioxygenase-like cupin family protein